MVPQVRHFPLVFGIFLTLMLSHFIDACFCISMEAPFVSVESLEAGGDGN